MSWKKKVAIGLGSFMAILVILFYVLIYPRLVIIAGYVAKNTCSCVFVAKMKENLVRKEDVNFNIFQFADVTLDYVNKTATASVMGLQARTAYFHKNTGCSLINQLNEEEIYTYPFNWTINKYDSLENWFTYIDTVEYLTSTQSAKLAKAINKAFIEEDTLAKKNTRAALVLYKGQLVGEQYSENFTKESKMLGWSMTKSLSASMTGMLANEGKFSIDEPTHIKAWQNDDRKNITWKQLLQMNSGLKWKEEYLKINDPVKMFFMSDGAGEYVTGLPQVYAPNTHWEYSSASTNIMMTELRTYFDSHEAYIRYIYTHLFYKIGMYSMLMETDAKGYFIGSSYSWATARDWAKFGQLYLQGGNWAGEQILPKSWVDFVQQPAPNSDNRYGGHFWLNKGGFHPDLPKDLYAVNGFMGQRVFIIPSKDLVVVRLGLTENREYFNFNNWLVEIIGAVEKP